VREYEPFIVAEIPASMSSQASERTGAFRSLAAYIFGGNGEGTKLSMTTPVISTKSAMQFVLPVAEQSEAPTPAQDSSVQVKKVYIMLRIDCYAYVNTKTNFMSICGFPSHDQFSCRALLLVLLNATPGDLIDRSFPKGRPSNA
jgi:hypothetical protein